MVTSLQIGDKKLMVMTMSEKDKVIIEISQADDQWQPVGIPLVRETEISEEEYHRGLRKEAIKKEQFVKQYSTNPELNN